MQQVHHAERDDYSKRGHRGMKNEQLPQNEVTAICTGRAGFAEHLTAAAPATNTGGECDQIGERRAACREPAARNEAMAVWIVLTAFG